MEKLQNRIFCQNRKITFSRKTNMNPHLLFKTKNMHIPVNTVRYILLIKLQKHMFYQTQIIVFHQNHKIKKANLENNKLI